LAHNGHLRRRSNRDSYRRVELTWA